MPVILKGKERDEYNKKVYSKEWLTSSEYRLASDYYDKDHSRETLETLVRAPGKKALECGIGTGEFFGLGLARGGKDVYGVDLSDTLLDDCKGRFAKEGFTVRLAMADVERLPFRDGSFDQTYAIGVMPYMKDLRAAVAEMVRVTRKGGLIAFDMMNVWHVSQFINYWYRVIEASTIGFKTIDRLKHFKRSLGLKTNFKDAPEKVNYRLISPPQIIRAMKGLPGRYRIRGYNVLLPLDLPILGRRGNLCGRSRLFSHGLKDNRFLKYFGAKLLITIEKL